ncbi:MAG: aminotransferase class I/II-fold pyridoxal phosphate-dependent enzyme, partial [Bdellovibrionales bacterium]|nr:aminotransferase class I/II-fold pyridoxal phosphate-dependent enzyme [Bdellovibrionales bacterium]
MDKGFLDHLNKELAGIREAGLYKTERVMTSPQQAMIRANGQQVLNLCANNYLGLSNHPQLVEAAMEGLKERGFGLSSVRFICGTQDIHKELESKLSEFLGTEDTILYSSCFDANGGLFEALLGEEDAIISDALNHASIIDGVRLCKAKRFRYANNDMTDLKAQLEAAKDCRFKMIATDGVFSMDGIIANLKAVCDL